LFHRTLERWLEAVPCVSSDQLVTLRPSMMTQTFDDAVSGFSGLIEKLPRES